MEVRANGIDIHYTMVGEGPTIVFSHSLACNGGEWNEQVQDLSKRFRVVCVDTRGHGQTTAPAGDYTLDQLADDMKGMLDTINVKQPHFCGLSMGGMIGQAAALKYPGIFKTLTLADTTSRYAPEAKSLWEGRIKAAREQGMGAIVQGTLERWLTESFRKTNVARTEEIAGYIRSTPVNGYAGCIAAISKINTTDRLREIRAPAQVICGELDAGTPPAMSQAIQKAMPGSNLVMIPNAAHLSNVDQPEAFTRALTTFIAKHS